MNNKLSFFNLFSYDGLETEADDGLYIYEVIEIIEDVKIGDRVLTKGEKFDSVWFSFMDGSFSFIRWNKSNTGHYEPQDLVKFTQEELIPWYTFQRVYT